MIVWIYFNLGLKFGFRVITALADDLCQELFEGLGVAWLILLT